MLADKPVISDDTNAIDPALLEILLANVSSLAAVFHKPPEAFVSRVKATVSADAGADVLGFCVTRLHGRCVRAACIVHFEYSCDLRYAQ